MDQEIKIQSYSLKELLYLYGNGNTPLSWKVWNVWIEPIKDKLGELKARKYSPKQVKMIFDHLGTP